MHFLLFFKTIFMSTNPAISTPQLSDFEIQKMQEVERRITSAKTPTQLEYSRNWVIDSFTGENQKYLLSKLDAIAEKLTKGMKTIERVAQRFPVDDEQFEPQTL